MTQDELKAAVLALGFERTFDDESIFIPSLKRALHTVYTDRPVTRTVRIALPELGRHTVAKSLLHEPNKDITLSLSGTAYAFRVCGRGSYTIGLDEGAYTGTFDTDMATVRGFSSPPSSITFTGEEAYTVYDLTEYARIIGSTTDAIPEPGEWHSIDLSERFSDYMAPESEPCRPDGVAIDGCSVQSGVLYIPSDLTGELVLTYRRRPVSPTLGMGDEEVDVPSETEELLPLLVASYIWLDDDPGKAQYYLSLYREGIVAIKRYASRSVGVRYVTNGWA